MSAVPHRDYVPVPLPERLRQPELRVVYGDEDETDLQASVSGTDERLNFLTHAGGFVASLFAGGWLAMQLPAVADTWVGLSCVSYGLAMCSVFGASTLSHGDYGPQRRELFRTLDQISIFLLIAATATPFLLTYCRHTVGLFLLTGTWLLALGGVATKLWITRERIVPVWYYVLVAWFPAICLYEISDNLGLGGMALLMCSAIGFMVGTWFLCNDHKATWFHAIWHLLVIFAAGCQFMTVLCFVVPAATLAR